MQAEYLQVSRLAIRNNRKMICVVWGQETHLVINEGSEGEVVKQIGKEPPHISVSIFPQTLVIEAVHLRDLSRFVVSP